MQNFTKTILNAVQKWTKKEIKNSTADWSQNDSDSSNYIKNRPFYEETVKNVIVDNLTSDDYANSNYPNCNFVPNQKYDVIWNGTLYKDLVCFFDGEFNVIATFDDYPFCIDDDGGNSLCIGTVDGEDASFTVSIIENKKNIKKIDAKYLSQPDWNQNDETASDYIKNRTHWAEDNRTGTVIEEKVFDNFASDHNGIYNTPYLDMQLDKVVEFDKTYTILWDGKFYEAQLREYEDGACFGHDYYVGTWEDTDLPFGINFGFTRDKFTFISARDEGVSHTVAVYEGSIVINKLGFEYLPDNVATINETKIIKANLQAIADTKMDATNPVGTGSFSMNRKADTEVGENSHAEGYNTTASGDYSHAEGYGTAANGDYSHAEGKNTIASGFASHAEGFYTTAYSDKQHVQGRYSIEDRDSKYAHIVGNGIYDYARSNAHTLDWNGVGWFQGGLQVGGNAQDDGAQTVMLNGDKELILVSSTEGSSKKFKITVDDSGTIAATEVAE